MKLLLPQLKKLSKSIILCLSILGNHSIGYAQELYNQNFNNLNIGNVTNDITGAIAGQAGYSYFANNGPTSSTSNNANASNAKIVSTGMMSLGLELTGPNGDGGGGLLWKDNFLPTLWANRNSGNDIIEIEVDINPGNGTSTSRNIFGIYIYTQNQEKVLAGFHVRASTRELFLVGYSTPSGRPAGSYTYSVTTLAANSFSRIGISYNKSTGTIRIKAPGLSPDGSIVNGSAAGTDPIEFDFITFDGNAGIPNTSSASMTFDNLVVRASDKDNLLSSSDIEKLNNLPIYTNPSKGQIHVSNIEKLGIKSIIVLDFQGKTVKSINTNNNQDVVVDLSELTSSIYNIFVTTENGKTYHQNVIINK